MDERLGRTRLIVLGFQHVLVMYAGNVTVPLLVAGALDLSADRTAFLINSDLFAAGLATLIQTVGIWKFGARLPVMMGATFLSVAPAMALGADPAMGLPAFYGALLVSGLVAIAIAPLIGRILVLFPAVVTGSLITLLGISLLSVAINWTAGSLTATSTAGGGLTIPNEAYGDPGRLAVAAFVIVVILLISRYGRGIWHSLAILIGLLLGTLVSIPLDTVHVQGLAEAAWIAPVTPFRFGVPTFHAGAIATMCVVMLITLVESTGVFLAVADMTGRVYRRDDLVQALRADGLGIVTGAIFNAFPYTSFSQNVGLVSMTAVRSRFVCAAGAIILIVLGLLPKLAHLVAAVPEPVLGGAGIVMFGMVAATGVRILGTIDFHREHQNLIIVASALGLGMIPVLSPRFFQHLPEWSTPVTSSGVLLGTLVALVLNVFFNRLRWKPS